MPARALFRLRVDLEAAFVVEDTVVSSDEERLLADRIDLLTTSTLTLILGGRPLRTGMGDGNGTGSKSTRTTARPSPSIEGNRSLVLLPAGDTVSVVGSLLISLSGMMSSVLMFDFPRRLVDLRATGTVSSDVQGSVFTTGGATSGSSTETAFFRPRPDFVAVELDGVDVTKVIVENRLFLGGATSLDAEDLVLRRLMFVEFS